MSLVYLSVSMQSDNSPQVKFLLLSVMCQKSYDSTLLSSYEVHSLFWITVKVWCPVGLKKKYIFFFILETSCNLTVSNLSQTEPMTTSLAASWCHRDRSMFDFKFTVGNFNLFILNHYNTCQKRPPPPT